MNLVHYEIDKGVRYEIDKEDIKLQNEKLKKKVALLEEIARLLVEVMKYE